MRAAHSRIAALEARAERHEAADWAYTLEPAYFALSDEERSKIDGLFQRFQEAFKGSAQDALSGFSDAELDTLESFCLACGRVDGEALR